MLAQNADLVARLTLQDQFSAPLGRVQSAMGGLNKIATNLGGAFTHFGGVLKNLVIGPLGLLLGSGGLLSIGGVLKRINDLAFATEKLSGITGEAAAPMSALVALFDRFGISADSTATKVAFTEKTLGKLNDTITANGVTTSAAIELQNKYGVRLLDAQGKVLPYLTILENVAQFYTSSAQASDKAALAAQLFGRSYADLVPILVLGKQGIADNLEALQKLGLTLTDQQARDLLNYRNAIRDAKDSISGLAQQIGLLLIPRFTELAGTITSFVSGHRADIVAWFDHAIEAGGRFIGQAETLIGKIEGFWTSLPAPLKGLLTGAVVGEASIKFLFGFDPGASLGNAITSIFSKGIGLGVQQGLTAAGLGKLFVQPVFVTNPGFGGALPGVGGAAAGAAAAGGFGIIGGVAVVAGLAGAVAITVLSTAAIHQKYMDLIAQGATAENARFAQFAALSAADQATAAKRYYGQVPTPTSTMGGIADRADEAAKAASDMITAGFAFNHAAQQMDDAATVMANSASDVQTGLSKWIQGTDLKGILAGIQQRSAAKYGGAGLGTAAVNDTFLRDMVKLAGRTADSTETLDQKIADVVKIEADIKANGQKVPGSIASLEATLRAKKLAVTVTDTFNGGSASARANTTIYVPTINAATGFVTGTHPVTTTSTALTPLESSTKVNAFAEGGLVTKPTLALIGETGKREWVIPEDKLPGFGLDTALGVVKNATARAALERNRTRFADRLPVIQQTFVANVSVSARDNQRATVTTTRYGQVYDSGLR